MLIHRGHDPKDLFKVWKENCLIGDDLNFDKENIVQHSTQNNKDMKKNNSNTQEKKTLMLSQSASEVSKNFPVPPSFAQRSAVTVLQC